MKNARTIKARLSKRMWSICAAAIALLAPVPSVAQTYLTPSAGLAFGGVTDDSKLTLGADIAFVGRGLLGAGIDFGYTKDFFSDAFPGSRDNVTTLMGNLIVISSGKPRFFGSAGLGLLKTRVEDAPGFLDASRNDWGMNVGAGVYIFGDGPLGFKGDIRYFRRLRDPEPDGEFDLDLGSLRYWRASAGLSFKF
jgi:hypothetical protein